MQYTKTTPLMKDGFYIDVGAWDPVIDSVSKAFYEHGWRGVHVEPLAEYSEKICQDRPEDKVIQGLVGKETGEMPEFGTDMATLSEGAGISQHFLKSLATGAINNW